MDGDALDEVLVRLGVGPWTLLFFTSSLLVPGILPVFLIGAEFINPPPSYMCNVPDSGYSHYNGSECVMVKEEAEQGGEVVECTSWTYDTSIFHSTVSMEWDLVCGRAFLSPWFQTGYTLGCFLGSVTAGVGGHRWGRRAMVRAGATTTVVGVALFTLAPYYWLVLVARVLLGVSTTAMVYPAFLLSMEVCTPRLRPVVGVMLALPYAVMMIILASLAYLIRDWRPLQLAASLPCLLLLLPFIVLVDESPRWLLVNGRVEEAVRALQRGAALNGVSLPDAAELRSLLRSFARQDEKGSNSHAAEELGHKHRQASIVDGPSDVEALEKDVQTLSTTTVTNKYRHSQEQEINVLSLEKSFNYHASRTCETDKGDKIASTGEVRAGGNLVAPVPCRRLGLRDGMGAWWASPLALVRTPAVRKIMLVLMSVWLLQGVVYLGLPLSSHSFSTPYLYMALLGAMEVPAYTVTAPITRQLGRRLVVAVCLVVAGTFLIGISVGIAASVDELTTMVLTIISYLFVCTAYQVNFLYAPELLPTTLRPWGTAVCMLVAYVGFSVPPFITDLLAVDYPWAPSAIFGCCGMVAGFLVLFLPETNGLPLPETVADLEIMFLPKKNKKIKRFGEKTVC